MISDTFAISKDKTTNLKAVQIAELHAITHIFFIYSFIYSFIFHITIFVLS